MALTPYQKSRQDFIHAGRPLKKKEKTYIRKVSVKRQEKLDAAKEERGENDTPKQKWFDARRKDTLVGICQCGCAQKSSKYDDVNFRSSCCHIFPQRLFPSIALHPLNCVERSFWNGCHFKMDNKSMDLWPNFADWDDLKEKFYILSPLLTDEDRKKKFYKHLEKLVYNQK